MFFTLLFRETCGFCLSTLYPVSCSRLSCFFDSLPPPQNAVQRGESTLAQRLSAVSPHLKAIKVTLLV
jgi:hypothetical protein